MLGGEGPPMDCKCGPIRGGGDMSRYDGYIREPICWAERKKQDEFRTPPSPNNAPVRVMDGKDSRIRLAIVS